VSRRHFFTSESVTEGHPDKIADQISDAILDGIYAQDPYGRVAIETLTTTGLIMIAGEIKTTCYVDMPKIAREVVRNIGYVRAKYGFDAETCAVVTSIDEQSPDIAQGVTKALEVRTKEEEEDEIARIGAGDQGMMFGFACDETEELMPLPIHLAHRLAERLAEVRKNGTLPYLRPDGKTQVTVEYEDDKPIRVEAVVISAQHSPDIALEDMAEDIKIEVIKKIIPENWLDNKTRYYINPTGRFVFGGPMADTGLTGRKIIVDTYGGYARHGGGAFSGKDPTKVDRSASYMARYVAKNLVKAGIAKKLEVQISYAIGVAHPISLRVDTFGTGRISDEKIVKLIGEYFDLRPGAIIKKLKLRRPIYRKTAAYGHFGRELEEFTWEKTDMAEILRKAAGL